MGFLLEEGAGLLGIDSLNIDDTDDGDRPAHSLLLGAGVPIVEHRCGLEWVPNLGARFHAVPVPMEGMGSFPVRAFVEVGDTPPLPDEACVTVAGVPGELAARRAGSRKAVRALAWIHHRSGVIAG